MAFNFFGFRSPPVIEDVEVKVPTTEAKHTSIVFDEVLAEQGAGKAATPGADALQAAVEPIEPTLTITPSHVETTAQPQTASVAPELLGQMDTAKATREDVIAAYKIFLGRLPESLAVVDPRVGVSPAALLVDFMASKEFLDQAPKSQLILAVAKKILDERNQAAATGTESKMHAPDAPASRSEGLPAA